MSTPPECLEKNSVHSGGLSIINCRPPMTKFVIEGLSLETFTDYALYSF